MSGASALFTLGGKTQYSNALWWHSFGANSTPTHFVYDIYFNMQDPNGPEALEFDVNQSMDGVRYIWGSECSYRDTGYWDIWNDETGKMGNHFRSLSGGFRQRMASSDLAD